MSNTTIMDIGSIASGIPEISANLIASSHEDSHKSGYCNGLRRSVNLTDVDRQRSSRQKNLSIGTEAREAFERWCSANGYRETKVFLAGWLLVKDLTHEERARLFRRVDDAEASAFASETSAREEGRAVVPGPEREPQSKPSGASAAKPPRTKRTA